MDKNLIDKIKSLREETGAPIGLIKEALELNQNDSEKAKLFLIKKGSEFLSKKSETTATKSLIEGYIHFNGKVGALVELGAETDFVTRNDDFKKLAHEIAVQVATMNPAYLNRDQIPTDLLEKEKENFKEEIKNKPKDVAEKINAGKLEKFFENVCLIDQPYFKDEKLKIKDLVSQAANKFKEKIEIKKFSRLSST
ncbi:MAG: elongation factor Ts [Patescibacteria group bacterium]|nr:elongation factor Ts [Patescibacteria group bacterium]MCL5257790.1 elongation factor Ts [Patescibacteria group bacterium]